MQQVNTQTPPQTAPEPSRTIFTLPAQDPSTSPMTDQPPVENSNNQNITQAKAKDPPSQPILTAPTKKERFLLIAADQGMGSPNERLNRVIQAKYEAGLLKPYNYVKGYARLSKWMDRK